MEVYIPATSVSNERTFRYNLLPEHASMGVILVQNLK